ncbi:MULTISPECIES: helix-turn-helix domain-containing protein [unclassified Mycobacterium]|uniref:helix-turn-helix domain-containing protein n=1 Tax=unclassified Mycobacterium TaxID=2642494 RepID=UPI00256FF6B5|nr:MULTISPECIES: helix-turn-helix domain-containing protein [unclassified Mycobacterium]
MRALREELGLSQDQLARAVTRAGLDWRTSRIGQLETSRMSASVSVLLALAAALSDVTGRPHRLADLLPSDGEVVISDRLSIPAMQLRRALLGEPVHSSTPSDSIDPRLDPGWGQVEDRVAVELPGHEAEILASGRGLFGRTGTQERDARAGDDATAQKRGRLTRVVVDEVLEVLRTNDGHAPRSMPRNR